MKILRILALLMTILTARHQALADKPAVHGMVLFGNNVTYISHLPMFHSPHDYQLLAKVGLLPAQNQAGARQTLSAYEKLKAAGASVFTVVPNKMDLTRFLSGSIQSFEADLYHGHFEKDGKIIGRLAVVVHQIIIGKKLKPTAPEENQYLLFGEQGEYFAAHIINGQPSFDLLQKITRPQRNALPVDDSALPLIASFFGSAENQVPAIGSQLGDTSLSAAVLATIHYETDELAHQH